MKTFLVILDVNARDAKDLVLAAPWKECYLCHKPSVVYMPVKPTSWFVNRKCVPMCPQCKRKYMPDRIIDFSYDI